METLQSGQDRPPIKQKTEPHIGPPGQLMGSYRPSNQPGPDMEHPVSGMGPPVQLMGSYRPVNGPVSHMETPEPGTEPPVPGTESPVPDIEPPGPNMDLLEMDESGRRSLGMSPQSQVMVKNNLMKRLSRMPGINDSTTWSNVKWKKYLQVKNDFMKRLSEIPDINHSTTWSDMKYKMNSYPSNDALFNDSHRENWFREYLKNLNEVKSNFIKMVVEIVDITKCTTWTDVKEKLSSDPRYKAVISDSYQEDWLNEYLNIVNDLKTDFMKRLSEIPGINNNTTWSIVKWKVNYLRYKTYVSNSHQEVWFQEYLKNLNNLKNDFMKRLSEIPGINNSTTWSDVKWKVNSDPRYKAIVSNSHQEDWFQEYLKNLYHAKNDFLKRLSEIPDINHSTTWNDMKCKVRSNPSYDALVSDSHRENWFREYMKNLNDVKNDFMKRLSEIPGINHSTTWSDMKNNFNSDPSNNALFSDSHRENWFREYLKNLNDVKSNFIKMLVEIVDITKCTTWTDVKGKLSSDPRYKAVISDSYREDWFNEYLKIVNDLKTDFMKKLSEISGVNNSTTWSVVKQKVNLDIRYTIYVSNSHQDDWFQEYLKNLYNMWKNDFMKKLSEIPVINCSTTWNDVKHQVRSDTHYKALVSNSDREAWIQEYVKIVNDMKNDFMKILSETPGINHFTTWSYIKSKVSSDAQYKTLVSDSRQMDWFREYLKTLNDAKKDFMKRLSKIPGINNSTTWTDVKTKVSSDPLYEAIVSDSHREDWFKKYLMILNDAKNNFMKRLSKTPDINHATAWSDIKRKVISCPQYKTLVSDSHREDWFKEYLKHLNDAKKDFMKRLSKIPGINNSTTWTDVKTKVSSDPLYEAIVSDSHREDWFKNYLIILNDAKNNFMEILSVIPDINHATTWSDIKSKVISCLQYKTLVSDSHREDWFKEYLENLNDMVKNDFMKKLSEIPGINCSTTWSAINNQVSSDPRYEAFVSDSHREDWIQEYVKIVNDMKNDFIKILSEMPDINRWTTWNDIKSKVSSDPQYTALVSDSHRMDWFSEYLKTLNDAKKDFMKRLSEIPGISNSTTWSEVKTKVSSDPLYEAMVSDSHREDWFRKYLKILNDAKNNFMKRLSETPDINHTTAWSDIKSKVISCPQYKTLVRDSDQEDWFNEYLENLNDAKKDFMKRLSEIPGINSSTTWSDMKTKVSSDPLYEAIVSDFHREDWFREYLKILNDAKNNFIKRLRITPDINHATTWSDIKSKVVLCPQYKTLVSDSHREDWFNEYLKNLNDVKDDFMKMLSEIPDINHSTSWIYVQNKVSSDPRYKAVIHDSQQEDWFREYLKTLYQVRNDFMKMLSEIPRIYHHRTWSQVESKVSSDPRYKAVITDSKREDLFREYLNTVNYVKNDLMERLSKIPGINDSTTWSNVKWKVNTDPCHTALFSDSHEENLLQKFLQVKNDFMKMLSEIPGINHHTTWSDVDIKVSSDPRYKAVVSESQREDLFWEYVKTVREVKNDFMKMLSKIPDINNSTTWSNVKSKVTLDPRCADLFHDSHQENWFQEYLQVKNNFMKMLSEIPGINHNTTWHNVKREVRSDPHYKAVVSHSQRKDLFREYLKTVNDVKNDFMKMLSEIPGINHHTTWSNVDIKVSSDPRYKAVVSDSQREDLFLEYLQTVNDMKNDFMARLIELPDINNSTTWSDVKTKVGSHPQYKALLSDSHQEDWFQEYLEILNDVKYDFMRRLGEIPGINNSTTWSDVKKILDPYPDYEAFFSYSHLENWLQEYLKTLND